MKKSSLFLLLPCLFFAAACGSSPSGKVLAEINGKKITEGDLEFLSTLNPNIAAQLATPHGKKQVLDNLVEQELLYQAGKNEGLDRKTDVQRKIDLYGKVILAQAFVEEASAKEARKYYDTHKGEFDRVKLSQIMIRYATPEEMKAARKTKSPNIAKHTEQEALKIANEIYDKLKGGADFAKLAGEVSEDTLTKDRGGDLGYVSRNDPKLTRRGLEPLIEKAYTTKVGEIAGPVKTTGGYSVITVTAPAEQAPFEEVKNQILFKMRGEMRGKILGELKEKSKVTYSKEFDPPAEPAPAPPQPVNK